MQHSSSRRSATPKIRQLCFSNHGGARRGAGRKPKGATALVSHAARPALAARFPVLVTMKLERGHPCLRRARERQALLDAFRAGRERHGMRLVHYSIQSNHVHALVEARDALALSRGMLGLAIRIARALNRVWTRTGRVWADRFHSRILRTPREVRNALVYVLHNARKHGVHVAGIDPHSSGAAFDGWKDTVVIKNGITSFTTPVTPARSWLLNIGWRKHGRIGTEEAPARDKALRAEAVTPCTRRWLAR